MIHSEIQAKTSIYQNIICLQQVCEVNLILQIKWITQKHVVLYVGTWVEWSKSKPPHLYQILWPKPTFELIFLIQASLWELSPMSLWPLNTKQFPSFVRSRVCHLIILPLDQGELSFVAQLWLLPKARETIAVFVVEKIPIGDLLSWTFYF